MSYPEAYDDTPVWHLLTMAEVYRCTGLMQLYRVFPDLLHNRLPNPTTTDSTSRDPFFPIDLDSMTIPASFDDPNLNNIANHQTHPSPSSLSNTPNIYTPHHQRQPQPSNQDQDQDPATSTQTKPTFQPEPFSDDAEYEPSGSGTETPTTSFHPRVFL